MAAVHRGRPGTGWYLFIRRRERVGSANTTTGQTIPSKTTTQPQPVGRQRARCPRPCTAAAEPRVHTRSWCSTARASPERPRTWCPSSRPGLGTMPSPPTTRATSESDFVRDVPARQGGRSRTTRARTCGSKETGAARRRHDDAGHPGVDAIVIVGLDLATPQLPVRHRGVPGSARSGLFAWRGASPGTRRTVERGVRSRSFA